MRVSKPAAPPALSADDWITCGVTHTIEVDGDQSWPKFEAGTKVRPDETPDEAFKRISAFVNEKAIAHAEATARAVQRYTEGQK